EALETCMLQNEIKRDEYEALMNQASSEEDLENVDRKFKCMLQCLSEEMEMVDSTGYIDVELIEQYQELSDDQRENIYECKRMHDEEPDMCEYAFKMTLCFKEKFGMGDYSSSGESAS
ncbi:hypothetical protein KR222_004447, partial [Zaprionus bogoriensis]